MGKRGDKWSKVELLTGEYRNTIDEKGRILFPSRLRAEITGNVLIVTQGIDRCLSLYTPEEWKIFSSKLMDASSDFDQKKRLVVRRLVAPAQEIEFDKSGRLSIPQSLREYAGLSKDCIVLGINKYMELWDSSKYREYLEQTESSFIEATESLANIFI